ncbi:Vitamin B12 transporter BtuB precursor [compost metagenome]
MKHLLVIAALVLSSTAMSQENPPSFETVVEDVVFNTSSRVIIDEKTIKDSHAPTITSLLSTAANVTITNTPFQPNSIYIRGGDASHVLIMVDGVPFYDASTIQRTFNLNSLDIKSVRRIEILKGSQTVLYGGQALSGVIMIETIPQDMTSAKTGLQGQLGNHNYKDISVVQLGETGENRGVVMRAQGAWRDTPSPVLGSSHTYARNNWNGEAAYVWKGSFEGLLKATYIQDFNMSPSSNFMTYKIVDVDDFEQYSRQLAASTRMKLNDAPWEPKLTLSAQNSVRTFDMPVNAYHSTVTDEDYGANLRTARLDVRPLKSEQLNINAGLSYIYEDFVYRNTNVEQDNESSEQRGLFVKADYTPIKQVELSVGGRIESWGSKDPVSTYQVGLTLFENTKLELSTGYKIPSLFQLYSRYGNPDLSEENSTQYSLTQEFKISDVQNLSVTLFSAQFSDLIIYTGSGMTGKYENVNKSESRGVEVVYTLKPTSDSSVTATYGYQEPRDLTNDRWLPRRPLVNGSLRLTKSFYDIHTVSLEGVAVGARIDRSGANAYTTLPGYAIANAAYSFRIDEGFNTYVRVNNLTDYRYEETYSYYAEGISGFVGAEYWFL